MKRKRKFKLKRKAWVEPEMMESGALKGLSGTAMWVLLRFQQKQTWGHAKQGGHKVKIYENSGLTFTYAEANHFGRSSATFYRSIKALVGRGFLDVEHRGGTFGSGEIKDYTRFKLSDRWKAWGTEDFVEKEFEVLKFKGEQIQARIKPRFQK